jgi:hypothetical protein
MVGFERVILFMQYKGLFKMGSALQTPPAKSRSEQRMTESKDRKSKPAAIKPKGILSSPL